MTDRRELRARRLLDPLWHGLTSARDQLYAEIEPGSTEAAMTVTVRAPDGLVVSYTIELDRPGVVHRVVVPEEQAALAAVEALMIDATPPDEPET